MSFSSSTGSQTKSRSNSKKSGHLYSHSRSHSQSQSRSHSHNKSIASNIMKNETNNNESKASKPVVSRGGWAAAAARGFSTNGSPAGKKATSPTHSSPKPVSPEEQITDTSSTLASVNAMTSNVSENSTSVSSSASVSSNPSSTALNHQRKESSGGGHINSFNSEEVQQYLSSKYQYYLQKSKDRSNQDVIQVYKPQESGWGKIGKKTAGTSKFENNSTIEVLNEIARAL